MYFIKNLSNHLIKNYIGYCRMTDSEIPTNNEMENFAKLVF